MKASYPEQQPNVENLIVDNMNLVKKIAWHMHGRVRSIFCQQYAGIFSFFAIFNPRALGLLETTKHTSILLSIIAFKLEPLPLKRTAILCFI